MYLNRDTKVFISTAAVTSLSDITNITSANTVEVSHLINVSEQILSTPIVFQESANSIGREVQRGILTRAGSQKNISISLATHIGIPDTEHINNSMLYSAMLTGKEASTQSGQANLPFTIKNNYKELKELTIIIVNKDIVVLYTNCIVNTLSIDVNLENLGNCNWEILAGRALYPTNMGLDTSYGLTVDNVTVSSIAEPSEIVANKLTLVTVEQSGYSIKQLAVTSVSLNFSNNAQHISDSPIGVYDNFMGYQLGAFSITGSAQVYLKSGEVLDTYKQLHAEYALAESSYHKLVTVILSSKTKKLSFSLGDCFIPPSSLELGQLITHTMNLGANNLYRDDLVISRL